MVAHLFFSFGRTWTILWISSPPCRRLAGSAAGRHSPFHGVAAVGVEASDRSFPL